MSTEGPNPAPNGELNGLGKLFHLDPVLLASVVTLVTGITAILGVELTEGKVQVYSVGILVFITVASQIWVRRKTLARRKVVAFLPRPTEQPAQLAAGQAVTTARDSLVLSAARTHGDSA